MGCLNCIDGIDIDIAQQEMLPEKDRQVAEGLGYIAGANVKAPAVATLNGVPANLAVTEFLAFFTGFRPVRRFIGYDFLKATVTPYTFPRDPHCFTCSRTGSLAVGDKGSALPVNPLINEPESDNLGETQMRKQAKDNQQPITDLLAHAKQRKLSIEGRADSRWFVVEDVELGQGFNRPTAQIMVKFFGDSVDPVIFVPEKIQLDSNSVICPNFLAAAPCLKGWKVLCPHMFQDVGDELLQFIACLCGFLAKPELCGCMGCPGRDAEKEDAQDGA